MKSTPKHPLHPCPTDPYGNHSEEYYEGVKCKTCLLKFDPEDHHYWSDPEFICLESENRKHSPEWKGGGECSYCGSVDYYKTPDYEASIDEMLEDTFYQLEVQSGKGTAREMRVRARESVQKIQDGARKYLENLK